MRRLNAKDLNAFQFIANIHETLPAAWIDDYQPSEESVKVTTEGLINKHETDVIFCSVIEDDNKPMPISFIWAEENKNNRKKIDIISLWTMEEFRGGGLAQKLKTALEIWAKEETNAEEIHTTVSTKNISMIKLNEKLDYKTKYYRMIKYL